MERLNQRIVLVVRKTRLEELVARFNTVEQARFYVRHLGGDFSDYEAEHRTYQQALQQAQAALSEIGRVHTLERKYLPNYLFAPDALVVVLGQDGLVANTLKYLDGQSVMGVNPDPARWDGVLLPFLPKHLKSVAPAALAGRRRVRSITMARVQLGDGQELHAVNDFFIGPRSHVSARYQIEQDGRSETQSSSGVIVSTGLGSTGWFRSLLAGAAGIASTPLDDELSTLRARGFAWESDYLRFTVREPFPSKTTQAELVFGTITADTPLRLASHMAGQGVIFSDGIDSDFLQFNSGMVATVTVADRSGCLVQ